MRDYPLLEVVPYSLNLLVELMKNLNLAVM